MRMLAALLALACGSAGAQGVCDRIRAMTAEPAVAAAHWGVSVVRLDGTVVCGVNEGQLFRPASNNKIFTTAAALALMGPDRRFSTSVVAEGKLKGGVLKGNLKLVGGGDANFGAHDLPYLPPSIRPGDLPPEPATIQDIEELAGKAVAGGLKRIDGDVVGDDFYLAWEPYPPDWTIEDAVYGYGAPVAGLTIHDNQINVVITPNEDRRHSSPLAMVTTTPAVPYYRLTNNVYTENENGPCSVDYTRAMGSKELAILGTVQTGQARGCNQDIAIEDPAEYAAMALKLALERRGVKVSGVARARHTPPFTHALLADSVEIDVFIGAALKKPLGVDRDPVSCEAQRVSNGTPEPEETVLATHQGPRLIDDMLYTMKVSQNLHAELMLRNLGASFSCVGAQSTGLAAVRAFMLHAGVAKGDTLLYDGSGLSGHDLVAPRAFTKFLTYAAGQPWFAQWKSTLPDGGVDGTLTSRFPGLKGRIAAKTGTLGESRTLSGYVTTTAGETMVFSIMVDTHLPGSADRMVMDRMVAAMAEMN